jgi:hypothetical protein
MKIKDWVSKNLRMSPAMDMALHAVILVAVASILVHGGNVDGDREQMYLEWRSHHQDMVSREERREVFFARWGKALKNAECEAAVIEAIKGEAGG